MRVLRRHLAPVLWGLFTATAVGLVWWWRADGHGVAWSRAGLGLMLMSAALVAGSVWALRMPPERQGEAGRHE